MPVERGGSAVHKARTEETNKVIVRAMQLEGRVLELLERDDGSRAVLQEKRKGQRKEGLDRWGRLKRASQAANDRRVRHRADRMLEEASGLYWVVAQGWRSVASRLVRKFAPHFEEVGLDDLMQLGMLGLWEAAKRYDPKRRLLFATYARWWCRAYITRNARTNENSGLAVETHRNLRKLEAEGMRGDANLAERLGISPARVRELRVLFLKPVSLDQPMSTDEEGGSTYGDQLAQPEEEPLNHERDVEILRAAIQWLPHRHRQVLQMRFGLEGPVMTLSQVGTALGISRERARQVERDALLQLRKEVAAHEVGADVLRDRVLRVAKNLPADGVSATAVADQLGTNFFSAKDYLDQLAEEGLVRKDRSLYFSVRRPPQPPSSARLRATAG